MDQNPERRFTELLVDPGLPGRIERIAKRDREEAIPVAERQAFMRYRFGIGNRAEIGFAGVQFVVAQRAVAESRGQFRRKLVRAQLCSIFQHLDQPPLLMNGVGLRERQFAQWESVVTGDRGFGLLHWMLPASSKIGKYMRSTTAPITRPIAAISAGSINFVSQSSKREMSSS